MLQVRNLHAGYGRIPILQGVGFAVEEGAFVGILGHNGMGKTTLLKTLMGLVRPTAGQVLLEGADVTGAPPYRLSRLGVGYVPQGREIFPELSVRDNLRFAAAAHGLDDAEGLERALADFPRLEPLLDRRGGALSGGEQQLLALARCLCAKPRLVLLDEPTEGIQPSVIDEIAEALTRLRASAGLTVILVEQNLDFIAALSDRVLIIQKGAITRAVTPDQLGDPDLVGEFVGIAG